MSKSLNLCLIFLVAIFVIGSVFAGGPFISADDGRQRIAIFTDDGRCIWEYPAAKPYAAWVLPEDRVLLANGHGVELITADKQAVWTYSTKEEVFGVDLLPSGNVIVAECTAGQLVELDKAGKVVHTIKVNSKTAGHMNMRNVRVTPKDTFLVGHMGDKAVREYDRSGNMINEFAVPDMAYMGERLENGNTLVGHKGGVVEFNAKKDIVWQLISNDLPEMGFSWITFVHRLANGNTVVGNWLGHGQHGKGVPVFEVTPDKKVAWKFTDTTAIVQATSFIPLTGTEIKPFMLPPSQPVAEGQIRFDFESGDLQGWRVVEGSFDNIISDRAQFHHGQGPYNKQGTYFMSTLETKAGNPNDQMTGVIESPVFKLTAPVITMIVGGGQSETTYLALCGLNGKEILKAHGRNGQPMNPVTWNVPQEFIGKPVFIRVVDANEGGWGHITVDNIVLNGMIDKDATQKYFAKRKKVSSQPSEIQAGNLREAIKDLTAKFGARYPKGQEFLKQLDAAEKEDDQDAMGKIATEALIANPLVSAQPMLYILRPQYPGDHHNTATMFQTREINTGSFNKMGGGALKMVDLGNGGKVTMLVDAGATGSVRDPELSFDGKKIIFSMRRNIEEDYHIYEVGIDGQGMKQLTSMPGVFDIDPLYLPDGGIVFTSSREPKYCMCNRHIMGNLYRMDGDGANIHQIGKSTLFEGHSSLMEDGRIMYDRWEYVDRNFGDAQGLWAVNPDGTAHVIYWGNNTASPGGVIDGHIIPGTQLCIATFGSCHDRPWGAIAIIDRRLGVDGRSSVVRTWPASAINLVDKGGLDTFKQVKPKYEDPYPLSSDYFLVSRMVGNGEEMGIYLLDTFGNEIELHRDAPGCYDPMPMAPRKSAPQKPQMRDYKGANGIFYVQDVYIGTHMQGVERGSVKYLRVVESPPKKNWTNPSWNGEGVHCPAMNWHNFEEKRILGTVPVEEDGSVHFECPSDKYIFFQLLDKDGMMVQSMRSGTIIQSGETQGCVGCHENRTEDTPPVTKQPIALKHKPSKLDGWYGKPRMFSYQDEVQPVFTKHCVECHDFDKPAGKKLNLAPDRTIAYNASYVDLWSLGYIKCVGAGPAQIQQAKSWGSHASKLIEVLQNGHKEGTPGYEKHKNLKLSKEELDRIITWVDINAPYYPFYESAYPDGVCGRAPIDGKQFNRLRELTKAPFVLGHGRNQHSQISFERPELSPCLAKLDKNSAEYREALDIIKAGGEQLKKLPRADMAGFVPCEKDLERNAKYTYLMEAEGKFREAISRNKKVYDRDFVK